MWSAWLCNTKSGRVHARLDLVSGSVEHELNGIGQWTVKFDGDILDSLPRGAWLPWMSSVLVCHRAAAGDPWAPVIFGPIMSMPQATIGLEGEKGQTVTLSGKDLRQILVHRFITGWQDWDGHSGTWDLQHTAMRVERASLGTIGEKLVAMVTQRRLAGELPIRYDPRLWQMGGNIPADDSHVRQYDAYNLSNNNVDKLLTDLSNCQGGPDFVFQPLCEQTEGRVTRVWVLMRHGLEGQPQVPQDDTPVWDCRTPGGPVRGLEITTDASSLRTRCWATGDGMNADMTMDVRQNMPLLSSGMPLLESVAAYSSVSNHAPLLAHVDADLARAAQPQVQWKASVDGREPGCRPGVDWFLGERVRFLAPATRATAAIAGRTNEPYAPGVVDVLGTVISMRCDVSSEFVAADIQEDR